MRFKVISILTSTVLGLLISGCSLAFSQDDSFMKQNPHPHSLSIEEKANHIVSQMSDSQKIGQLMMVGLQNTVIDEDANHMLANYPMGNVILFDRNMKEPEQLAKLNSDIKQTLTKKNVNHSSQPLLSLPLYSSIPVCFLQVRKVLIPVQMSATPARYMKRRPAASGRNTRASPRRICTSAAAI